MSRRHPRIVLAHCAGLELFDDAALDRIDALGTLTNREPLSKWTDPRARDLLADADVILGHWGCPKIDHEVVTAAPQLGLVAYAAGTVKEVITDAVWDRDIRVTSGANANAEPVAEYTLATILFANKRVFWPAGEAQTFRPVGNFDKTVGIVGASLIGRRVVELLGQFPHLSVLLYDPIVSPAEATAMGASKVELDELCARSDIVSIHAPALPSTRHMIGASQLAAMADGATLVNTARGSLVDHDALAAEASTGRIYAVLDVTEPEPLPDDSALRSLPNVLVTPHLAGSQGTELERLVRYATEEIERWAQGRPALNEVTKDQLARLA